MANSLAFSQLIKSVDFQLKPNLKWLEDDLGLTRPEVRVFALLPTRGCSGGAGGGGSAVG